MHAPTNKKIINIYPIETVKQQKYKLQNVNLQAFNNENALFGPSAMRMPALLLSTRYVKCPL